mgnify:CR=1 FL=1
MGLLLALLLHVLGDRVEDGRRGGLRAEPQSQADVAVEVAPSEGGVVAVGEAEARSRQTLAQGAEHAGLADTGLAREQDVAALGAGLDEAVEHALPRGGDPELLVGDVLVEGRRVEAEVGEPAGPTHRSAPCRRARRAAHRAGRRGRPVRPSWKRACDSSGAARSRRGRRRATAALAPRARPTAARSGR